MTVSHCYPNSICMRVLFVLWNAVPAKSKGYSAWLKSISYSIYYSIFGGNRSSTRFLPGKNSFFYSISFTLSLKNVIDLSLDFIVPLPDISLCKIDLSPVRRSGIATPRGGRGGGGGIWDKVSRARILLIQHV